MKGEGMKSLTLRNLHKTYFDPNVGTKVTAVQDISLEIAAGEFVAVVGPSGCGKSTILNMVAGFLPATRGDVIVGDRPVKGRGATAASSSRTSRFCRGRMSSTMSASA